ncbi:serine/threonine-protein kinase PRP4 homolog [Osmia bicornis bicornis]|uniref:serine/threonine-protein kinase PRP4 homolog n=1 Tax=Osmia bicornis bicornis TaxID=1437191 RepID=UPI0010F80886|nr:serine/threonine-protein kinase PRP4 homolog [Osmia bicornis bicornis]
MGTGQRRPSRSPRSQRSRSADVDCLKKYTERRVEERRHTEVADTSKLDPSRWIPLPKTITRVQPALKKSPQSSSKDEEKRRSVSCEPDENMLETPNVVVIKKLSPTKEEETTTKEAEEKNNGTTSSSTIRSTAGRSHSTDVGRVKNEKLIEERRHTECSDPRMIATRWLPQINTSRFRYDASPFARISNSCEITKNAATRWMMFVKNPSPSPIPRMNPERKPSETDTPSANDSPGKSAKNESPKWEPIRKFAPASMSKEPVQSQDEAGSTRDSPSRKQSPDANEQSKRLTQRMRDLYDFKTENEWPKRATSARRGNMWISKSSSEEEKSNLAIRRNSQDLEFNNRMNVIKLKDTKVQSDHQETKRPPLKDPPTGTFNSEYEERLRRFNERLRFSEDLGVSKPKIKERRTYSDDYEEKTRRASTRSAKSDNTSRLKQKSEESQESRYQVEKKRCSDASTKSRGSYAEVNPIKRDSRTSDVSYASISNYNAKRASVDCKSTRKMVELPPRRAFSQTEERPATPTPPVEWNNDRYAAARLKEISERQKRNSTRYKVYLT